MKPIPVGAVCFLQVLDAEQLCVVSPKGMARRVWKAVDAVKRRDLARCGGGGDSIWKVERSGRDWEGGASVTEIWDAEVGS